MAFCYPPQGSGGTGTGALALDDLTDVTITTPVADEVLRFNGLDWVNGAPSAVGAGIGVIFFLDSTKIIPAGVGPQTKSLETLLRSPSSAAEVDESQVVNNSTAIIDQYMHNTALGVTQIDGGEWEFDTYTYVSNAAGVSEVITSMGRVFVGAGTITITGVGVARTATVTGGTPFVAADFNADITQTGRIITPNAVLVITGFTSTSVVTVECLATYTNEAGVAYSVDRYMFQVTTGDISLLAVGLISTLTVQPAFAANTTDKLVSHFFARTNNVGNITVHLVHNGTEHYTHFHTPLQTKHNDLAGLQGGAANEFYHLTNAEYTGTGTGTFVRQNSPTLTGSPVLSTATATTINKVNITAPITTATLTIADSKTLNVTDDTTISGASTTVVSETAFGQAATQGVATTFSRGDHTHGTPAAPSANIVSDANRNTLGGTDALLSNVAGTDNTAFGYNTLKLSTGTGFNTGFGSFALDAVTTGINNTALGYNAGGAVATTNDTTCIGYNAGAVNTAADNTFIGSGAGDANTTGTGNLAIGKDALGANITGINNICIGSGAGASNTGSSNIYIGGSQSINGGGSNNIYIGIGVGSDAANTSNNVFIGYLSGRNNANGTRVTAVGTEALSANHDNYSDSTAVGYHAGYQNLGSRNTMLGTYANENAAGFSLAADNTCVGYKAGFINTAANNTFIGSSAGDANSSGTRNTAVGKDALGANTTSSDCTMVGYQAGLLSTGASNTFIGSTAGDANTTGNDNVAIGMNAFSDSTLYARNTCVGSQSAENAIGMSDSVALGYRALRICESNFNVAVGSESLKDLFANGNCVAIGFRSGFVNTAADNIFIGYLCGDANTTGTRNTAVGKDALGANTTTSDCTMVGYQAGLLSTGASNTFVGSSAGDANTTGNQNTALGVAALGGITTGTNCTAVGFAAGQNMTGSSNTFVGALCGDGSFSTTRNTAVGEEALSGATGDDCTCVGYRAGWNSTGANNTFVGSLCADANTTGARNTAIGKDALGANVSNNDCTVLGHQAGLLSTADNNTIIGSSAGDAVTTGANNTALGKDAMGANSTSADSTALGYQAGLTNTGANNVFVGSGADGSAAARANAIGIGKGVSVVADSTWVVGTIGIKQAIVEGANAAMGTATLVAGTVTVGNTLVTANSRIFLTSQDPNGGTQGAVFVSARTAGTDFTITSTVGAADTSIVAYEIKEPN